MHRRYALSKPTEKSVNFTSLYYIQVLHDLVGAVGLFVRQLTDSAGNPHQQDAHALQLLFNLAVAGDEVFLHIGLEWPQQGLHLPQSIDAGLGLGPLRRQCL